MRETLDIAAALAAGRRAGAPAALATVVGVEGSSYRRPGAKLLILGDGTSLGSVSGGCLEADVVRRARDALATGATSLVRYDTTADHDLLLGSGLGCQGVVEVFVEPLAMAPETRGKAAWLEAAPALRSSECLVTVLALGAAAANAGAAATPGPAAAEAGFATRPGPSAADVRVGATLRVASLGAGTTLRGRADWLGALAVAGDAAAEGRAPLADGSSGSPALDELLVALAREALAAGRPRRQRLRLGSLEVDAFADLLRPSPRLLVFGAGNDAQPLARFAASLGWRVAVVDHRPAYLTRERFPDAATLHPCRPEDAGSTLASTLTGRDGPLLVAVMTHNYASDLELLGALLDAPLAYLGLLGPRRRTSRLLAELGRRDDAWPESLHAPMGLDLGGEAPEAVALAAVAEMQATLAGRAGGPLRERLGPLHGP